MEKRLEFRRRATEGICFGGAAGSRGARDLGGYPERRVGRVTPPNFARLTSPEGYESNRSASRHLTLAESNPRSIR